MFSVDTINVGIILEKSTNNGGWTVNNLRLRARISFYQKLQLLCWNWKIVPPTLSLMSSFIVSCAMLPYYSWSWSVIQGNSEHTLDTLWTHPGSLGTPKKHSEITQRLLRAHLEITPNTLREQSGYTQRTLTSITSPTHAPKYAITKRQKD